MEKDGSIKKITVVTVCYNAVDSIEKTIQSVLSQTYPNIEYIIIDGGSKDGTLEVIGRYQHKISQLVSEPDRGIYDAMNKGIRLCTGEWINFMNAGDTFFSETVIEDIFGIDHTNDRVIYGSTLMKYTFGDYIVKPERIEMLTTSMIFCHQSVFVKREEATSHPFKDKYGLVADHGSLLEIYLSSPKGFSNYGGIIAIYDAKDGISSVNILKCYRQRIKMTNKNDSIYRKLRVMLRAYLPNFIKNPLERFYFSSNSRYERISKKDN